MYRTVWIIHCFNARAHVETRAIYYAEGLWDLPPPPKNLLIENYVKIALINRRYNDSGFASDEDLGAVS